MKKNEANFYRVSLALLMAGSIAFASCTQGNKDGQDNQAGQEAGKGVTEQTGDACEGAQMNNVLCHWVATSVEYKVKPPPPSSEEIYLRENEFNQNGQITKYAFSQVVGATKTTMFIETLTYNDLGKVVTKHIVPQAFPDNTTDFTHQYNANGDLSTQTIVTNDPTNPALPYTSTSTYDYQPGPPHDLMITKITTNAGGATVDSQTEKIIHTPDGGVLSWEFIYSDTTGTVINWQFMENTYRDGKKHNSLNKIDLCNPVACTPAVLAQGPSVINPWEMQKIHYEYDERHRAKSTLREYFTKVGGVFPTSAGISNSCEYKYDQETQAPMAHELPIADFQYWSLPNDRDFFSKHDVFSQAVCEINVPIAGAAPSKTEYALTITWKRLYEYLGVEKPK